METENRSPIALASETLRAVTLSVTGFAFQGIPLSRQTPCVTCAWPTSAVSLSVLRVRKPLSALELVLSYLDSNLVGQSVGHCNFSRHI